MTPSEIEAAAGEAAKFLADVARQTDGTTLAPGRPGLTWLAELLDDIAAEHAKLGAADRDDSIMLNGLFAGACLIAAEGGTWSREGDKLVVRLADGRSVSPFAAVAAQLAGGERVDALLA